MKISCIIIEDEPLARERIAGFVSQLPYLQLLASFESGIEALAFIKEKKIDLIFLDIQMDEFSGIHLLESSKIKSEVIFTTAYDQYALKGFDLNVTDYLLKPYTFQRFIQSVDKAKNNLAKGDTAREKKFIFVKTEYRLEKLSLNEILYIEGMRDYRRIHTRDKKIMTLQTFKEFEQEIAQNVICRVHKSFMVSLDKINSIEKDRIKIGEMMIPISETYKKQFMNLIDQAPKN